MKNENISSPLLLCSFEHNETNPNINISDSNNNQKEKKEVNEQSEFNNFNISFFLSKDLIEKIEEEEKLTIKNEINNGELENYSVKNNHNTNNINNFPINKCYENCSNTVLNKGKDNSATQIKNLNFININDFNNNYNLNNNNNIIINENDNQNNFIKHFLNINLFIPPNIYLNNNNFYNFQINNYNPNYNFNFNYNQNQSKYNYPNFYDPNKRICKNEAENIKIKKNKKIINDYTLEIFGRKGWICKNCNNFNYETRKKCNRCHIKKK